MSHFETPGAFPAVQRMFARLNARKEWEAQNPELAAIWAEAMALDAAWEHQREQEAKARGLEADALYQLGKLGVPQRAIQALQAGPGATKAVVAVREWLEADRRKETFLVLLGANGAGKTVGAAYAVLKWLLSTPTNGWATGMAPQDIAMWQAAADLAVLSSFHEADRIWFERMQATGLLILDELGGDAMHDHAQARLERLIDSRYGEAKRVVITSNTDAETFKARVGNRIVDRLRESGRVVNCGNQSLRGVRT